MMSCCEAAEVFALLEGGGGAGAARAAAAALAGLYGVVREPWLTRGLLAYHARTHSARAVDLLARAPEPHARLLLDHLLELLRGERPARHAALAALAPLAARRPAWLHRLPHHPLPRELLRAARNEREPLPALHALLALAALLPAAPAAAAPLWPDLADVLLHPAALDAAPATPAATAAAAHLRLARLALFHALYATHPCTLLDALRAELASAASGLARAACEGKLAPLLASVRLHPGLVTGSRAREADSTRWARLELHDVVAESRRLELRTPERGESPPEPAAAPAAAAPPEPASPPAGSGFAAARAVAALRPGVEPWFPLSERCGADSAPATPLPAEPDAAEPPEAAVEATPENTPAKETRAQFRFPAESGAVRAIGRKETSPPAAGPGADAVASRISRVMAERRAADSPVAFGGAPAAWGAGVARPQPSRPAPPDGEDREVRALTAAPPPATPPAAGGSPPPADPRRARPARPRPARPAAPPRRARSAPPRAVARACSVAVQTVDCWPEPYEFLVADFYRDMPDNPLMPVDPAESRGALPCERLDAHLAALYAGAGPPAPAPAAPATPATPANPAARADLAEQLALAHAALMYERWRRDAHAERNRRLLGRCRAARAQELQNGALRDRLRALTRERDELAARLARPAAAAGHPSACEAAAAAGAEREARLEAALRGERLALARAHARAADAEAECAAQAAALQRARGDSFEAARHVEALARAALAAARRGEQVRRLRRSLAVLGERDARLAALAGAAGGGGAPAPTAGEAERALRAAWARAEAEAGAAATRAEAASARAAEVEAALALREATLGELKRAARHAAEEHAARLRASQDKYDSLMRVLRAAEARRLERDAWDGDAPPS